jgi:hypothetical protein
MKVPYLLFVLASGALVFGQGAPTSFSPAPPHPAGITYVNGQLQIDATNISLAEVLSKVARLTGIQFDIPPEANAELMPVVKAGPGTSREVLALLLRETHFNFLIEASDSDPNKLQAVMILPEDKKGSAPTGPAEAVPSRSPFRKNQDTVEKQQERSLAANTPPDNADATQQEAAQSAPANDGPPVPSSLSQPEQSAALVAGASSAQIPSEGGRPGALTPPTVLSQQNISQQLQQMYTQRMQINQQGGQGSTASAPASNAKN